MLAGEQLFKRSLLLRTAGELHLDALHGHVGGGAAEVAAPSGKWVSGPAQAYDATRMLLMALSKSGPDSAKLRDAIENLDGFKGVTAAPSKPFSPDRHHSLEGKDMFAAQWKNGELVKAQ